MVYSTTLERWQARKGLVSSNLTASAFARQSDELRRTQSADRSLRRRVFRYNRIMQYVYILKCADGKPYTGCTDDLSERIDRHKNGYVPATKNRGPVSLISYTAFQNKYKAFAFEKYLKSGSGRAFLKKHLR